MPRASFGVAIVVLGGISPALLAQQTPADVTTIDCASDPGGRQHCSGDTSSGVLLVRSSGQAPCLLGKTWGYDDTGVWVADGCTARFALGAPKPAPQTPAPATVAPAEPTPAPASGETAPPETKSPEYVPNLGFLLYEGEMGQMYARLFSYARYLDQGDLNPSYTDAFGREHVVKQRQDIQLQKFFLPFAGWFVSPKFRYYLYVWSSNPSQGDPAQVVGAGNLSYTFNRFLTLGAGITSLPAVRSTEGQFPYWLSVDGRLTADEFFRGSYTSGVWVKGELATTLKYMAMLGNNLSTLGVSASQLDSSVSTSSYMLQWLPTTGEFGLYGTFGDYDYHDQVATRLGAHYTRSREDRQSQPGKDDIENSQIRLSDGSVIFTPDLFGPGIRVEKVLYEMSSLDAGIKYKGFSVEAEYYWRNLSDFQGSSTGGIADIEDHGYQLQLSAMPIPSVLQVYTGVSEIFGDYGDSSELRAGASWFPFAKRGVRVNAEWLHLNDCPVGYTAVPYPVGGSGDVYHVNAEMNF